jgi:FtsH-binding integral membrane protein
MSDFNRGLARPWTPGQADMASDAGLRAFMLGVYNKLALGLVLSGALAWLCSHQPVASLLYVLSPDGVLVGLTPAGALLRWAPLIVIFGSMFLMRNPSPRGAGALYWTMVSMIGAGLSIWLTIYTGVSVATTFFITAAAFGGLSLVGYTTKKDLTAFGSFLIMGVFGIVIASVVNMFLHSAGMAFIISLLGVLIFSGLIAYDTQRLKMTYYQLGGSEAGMSVATNYGALSLYLDFINLFQFLMMFMGGGSNRR